MILVDHPYVSDDLLRTIKENNFKIVSTKEARKLISDDALNWISEPEAKSIFSENPDSLIYTNSENSISWIENNLASSKLPGQVKVFKNKILFRELLQEHYPKYFFKAVKYSDLRTLNIEGIKFPFIVKPAVGFFSIAVHKVNTENEWSQALDKIDQELEALQGIYPKEVINISEFIIEENIDGDEFAIDCYFDSEGEPVVLMILHHVFSSANDVGDRVYSTSKEIIEKHLNNIESFLKIIGNKADLKNFPAHIEVRIDKEGKINPIEVNPIRFGGWCTTGDLAPYAFGFNSLEYYLRGKKPDWSKILATRKGKKWSIIVLDNNSGIKASEIKSFDYDYLLRDFENPRSLRKVDYAKYSVFGFLFTETTKGNEEELSRILGSSLKEYIRIKN